MQTCRFGDDDLSSSPANSRCYACRCICSEGSRYTTGCSKVSIDPALQKSSSISLRQVPSAHPQQDQQLFIGQQVPVVPQYSNGLWDCSISVNSFCLSSPWTGLFSTFSTVVPNNTSASCRAVSVVQLRQMNACILLGNV